MPGPVFLDGGRIALRTIEEEDQSFLQRSRNNPEIWRSMNRATPVTGDTQKAWYERRADDRSSVDLLITTKTDTLVGYISLDVVNERWGTGSLSFWVVPDEQGKGYATAAVRQVVAYAFDQRRLHKLLAHVFGSNEASCRLLERVGFDREGVHKQEVFVDGSYWDLLSYGLLEDVWRENAGP